VNEDVLAAILWLNKTIALLRIEPFDGTSAHAKLSLYLLYRSYRDYDR
jgi:hypothetical protein